VKVIESCELERLVRETFPQKPRFSADADLGLSARWGPAVAFVHGGCDPFLDRQLDDWLAGAAAFVAVYPLLNRLCRVGALAPGDYAVTHRPSSTLAFH
jgi:hypothetical protein